MGFPKMPLFSLLWNKKVIFGELPFVFYGNSINIFNQFQQFYGILPCNTCFILLNTGFCSKIGKNTTVLENTKNSMPIRSEILLFYSLTPLKKAKFCAIIFHAAGMWLSLVERCVRDAKAAGSNPVIPTISSVHNQPESWMWTLDFFAYICISLICMSRS